MRLSPLRRFIRHYAAAIFRCHYAADAAITPLFSLSLIFSLIIAAFIFFHVMLTLSIFADVSLMIFRHFRFDTLMITLRFLSFFIFAIADAAAAAIADAILPLIFLAAILRLPLLDDTLFAALLAPYAMPPPSCAADIFADISSLR